MTKHDLINIGPKYQQRINSYIVGNIYLFNKNNFAIYLYHDGYGSLAHCFGYVVERRVEYFFKNINNEEHINYLELDELLGIIKKDLIKLNELKGLI